MKNTEQKPPSDFEVMADFNRLYSAYLEARKGKRWKYAVVRFEVNLLENLMALHFLLTSRKYRPSPYNYFLVHEPKERLIMYIVENLVSIGWSMLIFLSAYLANVTFSLWYNIKLLHEPFDREKLINSAYKIATFVIGLTLLCVALTTLPLFANEVGWAIPQEYTDLFADLVIIGAVLLVSCKYIKEAFVKFTAILNAGTSDAQGKEKEVINYE